MKELFVKIKSVQNEIFIFDLSKMFKTMNIYFNVGLNQSEILYS